MSLPNHPLPYLRFEIIEAARMLHMDRDGSNCWVGVRHLAAVTGLDKSTVAEHRAAAIAGGWLIGSKQPRGGPSTDLRAALPDGVNPENTAVSGDAGQAAKKPESLSGLSPDPVRNEPPKCLARPDVPFIPISPFKSARELIGQTGLQQRNSPGPNENAEERRLRERLARDPRISEYRHDPDALARMTPVEHRFRGYEDAIRRIVRDKS
jgi:hypothetical protein